MTLREQILGADDRTPQVLDIPEWGASVRIRPVSGRERDAWEQQVQTAKKDGRPIDNFRAKLAAVIVVDERGERVFGDDDVAALGEKNGKALDRIFDAFLAMNKISDAEAKDVEKNS